MRFLLKSKEQVHPFSKHLYIKTIFVRAKKRAYVCKDKKLFLTKPNTPMRKRRTRQHIIEDLGFNHIERNILLSGNILRRYSVDTKNAFEKT
jgi:hypothetical protein